MAEHSLYSASYPFWALVFIITAYLATSTVSTTNYFSFSTKITLSRNFQPQYVIHSFCLCQILSSYFWPSYSEKAHYHIDLLTAHVRIMVAIAVDGNENSTNNSLLLVSTPLVIFPVLSSENVLKEFPDFIYVF